MAVSNMPPGYSEDGDAPSHGRDTAVYQELLPVKAAFEKWLAQNRRDLGSPELEAAADGIEGLLEQIEEGLNQPL